MTTPTGPGAPTTGTPLIAEDLLLLLFAPTSGTIAGEGTLFYPLAGAMLTDLALRSHVEIDEPALLGRKVRAIAGSPPSDPLLGEIWQRLARKPRGVQTFLAEIGPPLRQQLLDRLVERGDIRRENRKVLGLFPTTALRDGGTPRRAELVGAVRSVLVDGAEPDARTAVLAALLSASGSLPALHADIPWSGAVYTRGKELEAGDWGAAAAGDAVARTVTAISTAASLAVVSAARGN